MLAQFDIFKELSGNRVIWVEEVKDVVAARHRLQTLAEGERGKFKIWHEVTQKFVDPLDSE
jgi:hypothetical protein